MLRGAPRSRCTGSVHHRTLAVRPRAYTVTERGGSHRYCHRRYRMARTIVGTASFRRRFRRSGGRGPGSACYCTGCHRRCGARRVRGLGQSRLAFSRTDALRTGLGRRPPGRSTEVRAGMVCSHITI